MPRNPNKRRCQAAGCRAWAMRGQELCAAHRQRPSAPQPPPDIVSAGERLCALVRNDLAASLDDLTVIEDELRQLRAARALLADWAQHLGANGWEGCSPAQFLRAWSDSARQIVQLLRARRELLGTREDLVQLEAYEVLESYPGLRLVSGPEEDKGYGSSSTGC